MTNADELPPSRQNWRCQFACRALDDIETAMAAILAEDEAIDPPKSKTAQRKSNRGHLPKHLPRVEEIIEPESTICACGAERHIIGEVEEDQETVRGTVSPTTT